MDEKLTEPWISKNIPARECDIYQCRYLLEKRCKEKPIKGIHHANFGIYVPITLGFYADLKLLNMQEIKDILSELLSAFDFKIEESKYSNMNFIKVVNATVAHLFPPPEQTNDPYGIEFINHQSK